MSTSYRYTLPVEQTEWKFDGHTDVNFTWEYDENRAGLLQLYSKGKQQQWDAADRIDWSQDLDPENPMEMDDRVIQIHGSDIWNRMTEKERRQVRHHLQASQISQFMHGEQGALIATAKIVQTVPDLDAKFYAATQVMDEARHVEAYSRLLHDKFELAYPITHGLRSLLETGLSDSRWDMTYLTMQILIEGLALAAFQRIRDQARNPLAAAVNAYVMQDEARHVAFGRLALRDFYPQLTDAERKEREDFVVTACWQIRAKALDTRIGRNRRFVSPSMREARFTAGPMTVKSRRSAAPTLPKMTSPRCRPIPILTSGWSFSRRVLLIWPRRSRPSRAASSACTLAPEKSSSSAVGKIARTPSPMNFRVSPLRAPSGVTIASK